MKMFFLLLVFISSTAFSATCTNTTRSNYVTNQILTSSALNTDFNQLVTKLNAFDGGCVTAGTLESDALNTTQFAPMLKGIKEGCKVSYSNASTLSIGKCLASVDGNFVTTTAATTVSFGCSGCSSEAASTVYYVYIQTGSSGSTLNLLISTTAPNEDGYDDSGNKVLAKFYNNSSSNIDQYSIRQWRVNGFEFPRTDWISFTMSITGTTSNPSIATTTENNAARWRRIGDSMEIYYTYHHNNNGGASAGSGTYLFNLPTGYTIDTSKFDVGGDANPRASVGFAAVSTGNIDGPGFVKAYSSSALSIVYDVEDSAGAVPVSSSNAPLSSGAVAYSFVATVPIVGWGD